MSAVPQELYAPSAPMMAFGLSVPTMPPDLSFADQQELNSIAVNLRVHFAHLHDSMGHIAFYTAKLILKLKNNPADAQRFFCEVTGKAPSTFRTYRRAAKIIATHFAAANGDIPDFISNIPLAAFKLIEEATESSVIEAIELRASEGPVSEREMKVLIDAATHDLQARLDASQDQVADLTAEAQHAQANAVESARQARENEARANSATAELRSQERLNRDIQADRDALSHDLDEANDTIRRLSNQVTTVGTVEKQVTVVPPEFESLEAIQQELVAATSRRDALEAELSRLESAVGDVREAAETIETLETEVGRISALFPTALVEKLHNSDDQVSARIKRVAAQLRLLADVLSAPGSAA